MTSLELVSECWARGLDYSDYLHQSKHLNLHAFLEDSYDLICHGLDIDLERCMDKNPT